MRIWRKGWIRLYYRHTDKAPPPSMITLRLISHCNLRCVQCGQWGEKGVFTKVDRPAIAQELSGEQWKTFIARMASVCPHIYFFGGEPFLRKDLLDLVRFATSKNIIAGINTNGNFLKGKGRAIIDSGLDYLIVSLDGPRAINNQIRLGQLDVYSAVTEGVEELVLAKRQAGTHYPLIELFMTLTMENQAYITETAAIARRLGVDYFSLALGIFTTAELARASTEQFAQEFGVAPKFFNGFVRDVTAIRPDVVEAQIKEVHRMWGSRYKQYPPIKASFFDYFHKPERALTDKPCIAPWVSMQVMPNGDMAYCEDFPDLITGNILKEDPVALWNNPASRAWRRRIRTKGIFPAETRCGDYYLQ